MKKTVLFFFIAYIATAVWADEPIIIISSDTSSTVVSHSAEDMVKESGIIADMQIVKKIEDQEVPNSALSEQTQQAMQQQNEEVEVNEPTAREKDRSTRAFSMHSGLFIDVSAVNNMFCALDFFKPTVVVDFKRLSNNMQRSGAHVNAAAAIGLFSQFTVNEAHTVQFSINAESKGWENLPKNLIDLLGKGNIGQNELTGSFYLKGSAFADASLFYSLKRPNYSFGMQASYFVPVCYMHAPDAGYRIVKKPNGGYEFELKAPLQVYSEFPLFGNMQSSGISQILAKSGKGGADLSLSGSYSPAQWVTILMDIQRLPLFPVSLNKGFAVSYGYKGYINNVLNTIGKENGQLFSVETIGDGKPVSSLPPKKIMRQCKIRLGADFTPFENNYLIISPFIAAPVTEFIPFYMDGGAKIESRFAYDTLGVSYELKCVDRVWYNEVCCFLDSRLMTFNLTAAVASQSFVRAFTTLSGARIRLGIGMGF